MGDVYGLVTLSSGEHLNFPSAHPSNKLQDHLFSGAEGNGVMDMAQVGLEAGGDVDDAQLALEAGDLKGSAGELLSELLLPGAAFVQFLAGVECMVVDSRDESISDGVDSLVDVGVCAEEYLGCSRGYWWVFLLGISQGTGEVEGGRVFDGDDDTG